MNLKNILFFITLILLLILIKWFYPIAYTHFTHPQDDKEVYIRDDFSSESICDVLNGENDQDTIFFEITSKLSARIYDDYPTKTDSITKIDNWTLIAQSQDSWKFYELSRLKYEIWIRDDKKIGLLVFKGTSSFFDWHSNFHFLFKHLPFAKDQYEQMPLAILDIEEELKDYPGTVIYSTGHSLGGGLAQNALYRSGKIKKAFVFNSSPFTGWHDLDKQTRTKNTKDTQIYRIHENGEVLELIRVFRSTEYLFGAKVNDNPHFKEYRFNMFPGGVMSQHKIGPISNYIESKRSSCATK